MKTKNQIFNLCLSAAFGISSLALNAQAKIQIIHNSPDAAASVVDVWVNGSLLFVDNLAFRSATEFKIAPSGTPLTIEIKGGNSDQNSPAVASFNVTLDAGKTYVAVASGIVSGSGYSPATPFDLYIYDMGRESASNASNTDVLVFHGSTDAPIVDVNEVGVPAGLIVDNLAYGNFQGYLELPTLDFKLQVRNELNNVAVVEYSAPLQTLNLNGAAAVVVASGFLNPANNSNGPAFGLFVALPAGGALAPLPSTEFTAAKIQFIHNSADAAAAEVDVYLNGVLAIDNFKFRNSTAFVNVPVPAFNTSNTIRICPPNSVNDQNFIKEFSSTVVSETYVVVVNGIASATGYNPAPELTLNAYRNARTEAENENNADILVTHGSTDAGTVAVNEANLGVVIPEFNYTDFAGYVSLPSTANYTIQIRDVAQTTTVASFLAPINTLNLGGTALTVVASGFLNPSQNSAGPAFGLWVATANEGPLLELPLAVDPTAKVQIIHNSADAAAAEVDVWLNNTLVKDNFKFRSATEFLDVPANIQHEVRISPSNSVDTTGAIKKFIVNFEPDKNYIAIANGIASASGYNPSPELTLHVYDDAKLVASSGSLTEVLIYHGSTDAPTVDIFDVKNVPVQIINNLSYSEFTSSVALPTQNYILQITDESGANVVASYDASLLELGLGGKAITILASGFLNPANNSNGAGFGLWVSSAEGGNLLQLSNVTSVNEAEKLNFNIYPNPANDLAFIELDLDKSKDLNIRIVDIQGRILSYSAKGMQGAGFNRYEINTQNLSSGIYFIELISSESTSVRKLVINK